MKNKTKFRWDIHKLSPQMARINDPYYRNLVEIDTLIEDLAVFWKIIYDRPTFQLTFTGHYSTISKTFTFSDHRATFIFLMKAHRELKTTFSQICLPLETHFDKEADIAFQMNVTIQPHIVNTLMNEVEAKEMECITSSCKYISQCHDLEGEYEILKAIESQEFDYYTANPVTVPENLRINYINAICFEISHRMGEMNVNFQRPLGFRIFYSPKSSRIFLFEPSDNKFAQFYQAPHLLITQYYLIELYALYTHELIPILCKMYYGFRHDDAGEIYFYRTYIQDALTKILELNQSYSQIGNHLSQLSSEIPLEQAPEEYLLEYQQIKSNYLQTIARIQRPFKVPEEPMSTSDEIPINHRP